MASRGVAVIDPANLPFDPEALRARYKIERDKRIRKEGARQYVEIAGKHAALMHDSHVAGPPPARAPLTDHVYVCILGGGFGGMLAAVRLRQLGFAPEQTRILEKAGGYGGTWWYNQYPGAACDTESYIYLPLLEETGYMPRKKYSDAKEMLDHTKRIADMWNLWGNSYFQTEVKELRWDEGACLWHVKTDRGDNFTATFVISAGGPLHRPHLPGIPGIETFKGKAFHSSRWDYSYTGGDSDGNLHKLKDKRVAIIGTGATSVQIVPHLGRDAKELYVFQRTPSSVDVRNDKPTDPEWVKSLKPGWHRHRMGNFEASAAGLLAPEGDLVQDGWTDIARSIRLAVAKGDTNLSAEEIAQLADFQKMEQIRARVDSIVKDKRTAELLKPWYNQGCKRACFHDEYLPTFNRPNVHLVDTDGKGVERIEEKGVVVDGKLYEVDLIVYASGFEATTGYERRIQCKIHGRNGVTIEQRWKRGMRTLHGLATRELPNLFFVQNAQSGASINFLYTTDAQVGHAAWIIAAARDNGWKAVEPSEKGEAEWVDTITKLSQMRTKWLEECTPSRFNGEGAGISEKGRAYSAYGKGINAFIQCLEDWRKDGKMQGLEILHKDGTKTEGLAEPVGKARL
ncbi:putative monooxygenase [Hyaloraphidium curvatum]|nr:putative monooxygenase [Hyaloraphidium curvatum]